MTRIRAISTLLLAATMVVLVLAYAVRAVAEPAPAPSPGASASASAGPSTAATVPPKVVKKATPRPRPAASSADPNAKQPHRHVNLRADHLIHGENKTIARGHAVAITESAYIEGDELEVDHVANKLYARGNVVVRMNGDEVHAESGVYDLRTGVADLQDTFGIAHNINLYKNSIEDAMYFWSPRIRWDGQVMRLVKATVTTCDKPFGQQDYKITGDVINVYPDDRMEIRKGRVYLHDKQILGRELLVFSLHRRERKSFVPQVGYNKTDGAYIRQNLPFILSPGTYGNAWLTAFSKSGLGYGLDTTYQLPAGLGWGNLYFFNLAAPPQQQSRYQLHNTTNLVLTNTMRASVGYFSDRYDSTDPTLFTPPSQAISFSLYDYGPRHTLSLSSATFQSNIANSSQVNHTVFYGLLMEQRYTDRVKNTIDISASNSQSGSFHSYTLHALDRISYRAPLFDTDLMVEKTGSTGSPIYLVNRLPELSVRSHMFNIGPLPVRLSVSAGQIQEEPSGTNVGRADMQFALPDTYLPLGEHGSLLFGAGFRQLFYDNGDSQYYGALRADWIQDWSSHWRTHLDYRLQRGDGYTPIQSDFYGQYNSVSGGVEYHDRDRWFLSVDAGRDLLFARNYDLRARLSAKPFGDFRIDLGTSFDIDNKQPLQLDSRLRLPISPSFNVQYYSLYDFVNNRLTYQDFMLQNESHDFLTSLIYRGVQKEIYLQVNIKAFPFQLPSVGANDTQPVLPRTPSRGFRTDIQQTPAPTLSR